MLKEAMEENQAGLKKVTRKVKVMLDELLEIAGDTKKSVRGRLKDIAVVMDGEESSHASGPMR
jgi:hypothetical protein